MILTIIIITVVWMSGKNWTKRGHLVENPTCCRRDYYYYC